MTRSINRVFVLGSNSFSGARFVAHLLERGVEVIGASRSPEPYDAFLPYRWTGTGKGYRFLQLDVNHDLESITAVVRDARPSCVVNFAAQSMVAESWLYPDQWFTTNVLSTIRLHEEFRRFDFIESYVHVTTPEVYGSTAGIVTEDTIFNPSTPYAVSRAAADMSLRTYHAQYGFPVIFTRAANVYGEGQQLYRIIPRTILSIREGRKLQLHGGGVSERSFIHIDDVSDATRIIAQTGTVGETYHISTDRIVTVRSLVEIICTKLGVRFQDHVELADERPGKDAAYRLSSHKIRSELRWNDRIALEDGIERVVRWVDKFRPVLSKMSWDYQHKP